MNSVLKKSPERHFRAVSRHDSSHQLVINRTSIASRFPEVPTIQLIGFLLL